MFFAEKRRAFNMFLVGLDWIVLMHLCRVPQPRYVFKWHLAPHPLERERRSRRIWLLSSVGFLPSTALPLPGWLVELAIRQKNNKHLAPSEWKRTGLQLGLCLSRDREIIPSKESCVSPRSKDLFIRWLVINQFRRRRRPRDLFLNKSRLWM